MFKNYSDSDKLAVYDSKPENVFVVEKDGFYSCKGYKYYEATEDYVTAAEITDENGNINCAGCIGCTNCRDCQDCVNCHDCVKCWGCTSCIKCEECEVCTKCGECNLSGSCTSCINCKGCNDVSSLKNSFGNCGEMDYPCYTTRMVY